MGVITGTGAAPTIDYGKVRELLVNYYKLTNPSKSEIPLQLENYSLNGEKIIELIDSLVKLHPEYIVLSNRNSELEKRVKDLRDDLLEDGDRP